jgi:hypothetical protein
MDNGIKELCAQAEAYLLEKGFSKVNGTTLALGDIRVTLPAVGLRNTSRRFSVMIRDNVQRGKRVENLRYMQKHVETCIEIRNDCMDKFKAFCLNVQSILSQRGLELDLKIEARTRASFTLHGTSLFALQASFDHEGRDQKLVMDIWCPDLDEELEVPEDIVKACQHAHKYRRGQLISEGTKIITTEQPHVFAAVMLENPCIGIEKKSCVVREVCDDENMQLILNFEGRSRKQDMVVISFANDVTLTPLVVREPKVFRVREEDCDD